MKPKPAGYAVDILPLGHDTNNLKLVYSGTRDAMEFGIRCGRTDLPVDRRGKQHSTHTGEDKAELELFFPVRAL